MPWDRDQEEESMKAFRWLLEKELGLDAENWRLGSRRVIAKRTERLRRLPRRERRRRQHETHVEELTERSQIGAGENVSSLFEGRLLELAKARRCPSFPPE